MGICSFVVLWEVSHVVFDPCGGFIPLHTQMPDPPYEVANHEVSRGDDVDHEDETVHCVTAVRDAKEKG